MHCVIVSLCHCVTVSLCHCVIVSLCHYVIVSLCRCVVALQSTYLAPTGSRMPSLLSNTQGLSDTHLLLWCKLNGYQRTYAV